MFGLWCNGSTTGFGSVCPGSNPGSPTLTVLRVYLSELFLYIAIRLFYKKQFVLIIHYHVNGLLGLNVLTPKHRLNGVLMYEVEDRWKIGLEAYYFSPQKLSDGQKGKQNVVCGFMIEKIWDKFSLYANFENFTDRRQTCFDTIYTGNISTPIFRDIYAPLNGFVMNAGIKIRF